MSNPVNINQLVDVQSIDKALNGIITDLEKINTLTDNLVKDAGKIKFGDAESIKKFSDLETKINKTQKTTNENIKKATSLQQERQKIQKQVNTTFNKTLAASEKNNKILIKGKEALKQQNAAIKEEIKLEKAAKDSIVAKQAKLKKLVNEYNNASSVSRTKLAPSIKNLQTEINKSNEAIGRSQGFVGQYQRAFKGLKGVLVGGIGIGAIVTGFKALIKNSANFEKSLSSLSAITGAIGEELEYFEEKAKETSLVTLQSAEEIVKAYELVGSIRPELLKNSQALANVTKQAIILSEATGGKLGLEASAKALTSTLNQFNLSSSQSARVINALAAGSKFGSATADLLSESFKNSGAVLADANVTVEQAIALTEVLAEKQIVGTEAGTKLRGSVLKLQQAGVGYVSGQFNINDALEEANQLLEEQETQAQRDKLAIKLFGAENITTGKILLNNVETFEKLTEQVTGTTTALEQQETQNDNLASSWVKLTNTK